MAAASTRGQSPSLLPASQQQQQQVDHGAPPIKMASQEEKGFLDTMSPTSQFVVLGFCMFLFFGIHNVLQEAMMSLPGFNYGVMLGYMEVIG
jgi:hypothetical protein